MSMKFTERDIQRFLYRRNHQRFNVLLPNYTPLGWWECDLFGVTRSGYFHEFEIKVTRADFRKDAAKKRRDSWQWVGAERQTIAGKLKHSQIKSENGPARFWYVLPEGLIELEEVPEWAGFQVICEKFGGHVRIVRQAPQLHRTKIRDSILRHSLSVCYYRYWNERNNHDDTLRDRQSLYQRLSSMEGAVTVP